MTPERNPPAEALIWGSALAVCATIIWVVWAFLHSISLAGYL